MVRILHPRSINPVCIDDKVIENNVIFAVLAFMLVYGGSIIWLTFLLLLSGLDVTTAFTAIVACVNNTGPGVEPGGSGVELRRAERLSDLGLHLCDADRAARAIFGAGAADARFLA